MPGGGANVGFAVMAEMIYAASASALFKYPGALATALIVNDVETEIGVE